MPNFLEEDYLEALSVRKYLETKESHEECSVAEWKFQKEISMYFSDVGIKRRKFNSPNDISVHQVAAQRMLGTALEREGKSDRTILQTIEKRILSTWFKGK